MKGNWKPRCEYKTLTDTHYPILTRSKDGSMPPMVVIWSVRGGAGLGKGHFYPVPSSPVFVASHEFSMWTNDHFDEWMEIPE